MDDGNFLPKGGFRRGMLAGVIFIVFAFFVLAGLFPLGVPKIVVASVPSETAQTMTEVLEVAEQQAIEAVAAETPDPVFPVDAPQAIPTLADNSDAETSGVALPESSSETAMVIATAPQLSGTESIAPDEVSSIEVAEKPIGGFEPTGQTNIPTAGETASVENAAGGLAFETYALTFGDFTGKPLLSIILLAETIEQADSVSALTIPVTLAVSPLNPDAAAIIGQYRAKGGEVVLMLPSNGALSLQNVTAENVPAVVTMALENTTGVIGIIDSNSGEDATQVNAVLTELGKTGHALITTTSVTVESGVSATSIIGTLDNLEGKIAVLREMDNAVVQIGSGTSGTVFGNASDDTISAISFWLKSQKAQTVTVAPVSASILRN